MAKVSVKGWIAEGGGRLFHEEEGDFILFDLIESKSDKDDIENEFGTTPAWFHCSFHVGMEGSKDAGFVPRGFTIERVGCRGYARVKKEGSENEYLPKNPHLRCDQIIDFIQEGKFVFVSGQEFLLEGDDGDIRRDIHVGDLDFIQSDLPERPHLLKVPYKSNCYYIPRN